MHHQSARVVHRAAVEQPVALKEKRRRPPVVAPNPVRHDRVQEAGNNRGVQGVRFEQEPLRHGAADDGGARGGEGKRKEKPGVKRRVTRGLRHSGVLPDKEAPPAEREIGRPDEPVPVAVQKPVPEEVKRHGAATHVWSLEEVSVVWSNSHEYRFVQTCTSTGKCYG